MNSGIKLSARFAMSNSYLKILPLLTMIIFTVFVFSLCNAAANIFVNARGFTLSFAVFSLFAFVAITAPIRYKLEIRHLLLARGCRSVKTKIGISGMTKSLFFYSVLFCLKSFWFAVFEAIPVSATAMLYFHIGNEPVSAKATLVLGICIVILSAAGIMFYSVFIQRYSKAAFYLACYEDFSAFDAIRESVRKTRGNLSDILLFKLGFLPWFLLCIGIAPMLFVIPYYKQSLTCCFLRQRF